MGKLEELKSKVNKIVLEANEFRQLEEDTRTNEYFLNKLFLYNNPEIRDCKKNIYD